MCVCNGIKDGVRGQCTKTTIENSCQTLHENGDVIIKAFGKNGKTKIVFYKTNLKQISKKCVI